MVASALADEVSWRARAGKLPYRRMFPSVGFAPQHAHACCVGSPVPVSRSRSELGRACVARLPWHHAAAEGNDSEYRPAPGPVNWNRTTPATSWL